MACESAPRRRRVESVDILRGIVMVVMALDHVRDFFGGTGVSPTNLATTTVRAIYLIWVLVVVALYPACRWYAGVRAHSRSRWLSYV